MKRVLTYLLALLLVCGVYENPAMAAEQPAKFPFTVTLRDANGEELAGSFEYSGSATGTLHSGDTIYLADGESIEILDLPAGTQYTVVEGETDGYTQVSGTNTEGSILTNQESHAEFVNQESPKELSSPLPMTGGNGYMLQTLCSMAIISLSTFLLIRRRYSKGI